jgi:hypothetical protein
MTSGICRRGEEKSYILKVTRDRRGVKRMVKEFRGLQYTPSYENEVILLFGLLMSHLDDKFVIEEYSGSFPDCYAQRNEKDIGIEFEVYSNDFIQHGHPQDPNLSKCKLIVCWENNWKENKRVFTDSNGVSHEIEVYPLKEVLREKGLNFIKSDKPKYGKRVVWSEHSFFEELRSKVNPSDFVKVSEIYTLCLSHPQFEVVFGEGPRIASFNVRVKKWQSKKTGVRSPIQVYADGKLTVDYQNLPKNLETELRQITGNPKDRKTGRPKEWYSFDLRNERTFDMIKKTLVWLSEM